MKTTNVDITTKYANSIFEQPWYLDTVTNGKWTEIKVEEKGEVVARWAVPCDNNKIAMPGETQTLGIWFAPDIKASKQQKYIEELVKLLPKNSSFDIMLDPSNDYFLPFRWLGFKVSPRITYRFTDVSDIETVRAKYDKTVRKNIKSARNKVEIIEEDNVDNLYAYDEKTCYYLIAGADPTYRASGAQTLVLDSGIEFASKHSKAFDFEGSMIEGIENFFRRFGADRVLYYQIEKKGFIGELKSLLKPRVKKLLGYKN